MELDMRDSDKRTILELNSHCLILAFHQKSGVVLAALTCCSACAVAGDGRIKTHLTSFMMGALIQSRRARWVCRRWKGSRMDVAAAVAVAFAVVDRPGP